MVFALGRSVPFDGQQVTGLRSFQLVTLRTRFTSRDRGLSFGSESVLYFLCLTHGGRKEEPRRALAWLPQTSTTARWFPTTRRDRTRPPWVWFYEPELMEFLLFLHRLAHRVLTALSPRRIIASSLRILYCSTVQFFFPFSTSLSRVLLPPAQPLRLSPSCFIELHRFINRSQYESRRIHPQAHTLFWLLSNRHFVRIAAHTITYIQQYSTRRPYMPNRFLHFSAHIHPRWAPLCCLPPCIICLFPRVISFRPPWFSVMDPCESPLHIHARRTCGDFFFTLLLSLAAPHDHYS